MNKFLLIGLLVVYVSCSTNAFENSSVKEKNQSQATDLSLTINTGSKVMMQAFYWDVPAGGTWWNTISTKLEYWSNAGIDAIWLPPISKAQNGPFSMSYDPFDYFDFGDYDQMGSTETRFGARQELESLIKNAHNHNVAVIADIVINHNSGGDLESNIYTGTDTYTDFNPASGLFQRSSTDFHPNDNHSNDSGVFGGYPDLCHDKSYVQDWLWKQPYSVAKYYKNTLGVDGWRFDYVKGYKPWVVNAWIDEVSGFAVGEYWDANVNLLENWTHKAQASAFDFACYYKMKDAFDGNDLTYLQDDMLWKRNPMRAVTFVSNHDTNEILAGKILAYAYILTHEGYPCIFYQDYEEWLDKDKLNNLIWIHNKKASGTTDILHVDQDEYIARRNGSPGLIVYLNNSNNWKERWVQTNWNGTLIKDYTGNSNWEPYTQPNGWIKVQAPPNSYSIWSPK
ncbi:alpha-amylase [Mesonia aestuariivivens]|uniref:Alpha-amylase n=1 Tax=Mesonia aestuariivivens TaxID=2796128 RepID=A0ABS6W3N6_9FLAO|nr:alpha-amylase [Mesonia aestuariivivens]MBW2962482.1 alpha-amylase [Mesonia aestuariivivens]